ncbi:MAG: IclR family transcriptional regulator domain-containing protein [Sciscionella sp.]
MLGVSGEVIGAVSVCGPRYRVTAELAHEIAPRVIAAAEQVSRRMGWHGQR